MAGKARACNCQHRTLCLDTSPHAAVVGYHRPSAERRATAAGLKSTQVATLSAATFPAPLVLPGDDLALDPKWPPQSLRSWLRLEERNAVTSERNVIYVAPPPNLEAEVDFMKSWSQPKISHGVGEAASIAPPRAQDVQDYITAFYHPLPVKLLNTPLAFCNWDTSRPLFAKRSAPKYVGLKTTSELVGIRTRRCKDKVFPRQVNADDLLDAAMSILPQDAYALLMLTEQDLYDDDDDSFSCGKAYGGSRVSVASMARYNPSLDTRMGVDREHSWPASHCGEYIKDCCARETRECLPIKKKAKLSSFDSPSPLSTAVAALVLSPHHHQRSASSSSLYLARICRTASHELGHCFGFEHCTYYACIMQGCANLAEDARQPPYLCPVDLAKLKQAVFFAAGAGDLKKEEKKKKKEKEKDEQDEREWIEERYRALERVCGRMREGDGEEGTGGFWDAFSIWIQGRLHGDLPEHE